MQKKKKHHTHHYQLSRARDVIKYIGVRLRIQNESIDRDLRQLRTGAKYEEKSTETARGTYWLVGVQFVVERKSRTKTKMHSAAPYAVESGVMRFPICSNRLL